VSQDISNVISRSEEDYVSTLTNVIAIGSRV